MITPTKGVAPDRSLLAIGARVLPLLDTPRTVSRVWALFRAHEATRAHGTRGGQPRGDHVRVSFASFTLALDLLYALDLVDLRGGTLVAVRPETGQAVRPRTGEAARTERAGEGGDAA